MDFANIMSQFGGGGLNNIGAANFGGAGGFNKNGSLWPLLLLLGLNGNGNGLFGGGNGSSQNAQPQLACYPNTQSQSGGFPVQTAAAYPEVKYRKKRRDYTKEAYVEVPVSTYKVVQGCNYSSCPTSSPVPMYDSQPMMNCSQPMMATMGNQCNNQNNNGNLLWLILILSSLFQNNNQSCVEPHHHTKGDVSSVEL